MVQKGETKLCSRSGVQDINHIVLRSIDYFILQMTNCPSACANRAVVLVIQKDGGFTATVSTMVTYNVVVRVGIINEDNTKFQVG